MTATGPSFTHDPECDLLLERLVDVPVELVWKAWTEPEHVKAWFTPRPWQTVACEIDLHPGGRFATVMRDPEGNEYPNVGCYLEVHEPTRLVFTSALHPGYRPLGPDEDGGLLFTAELTFEPVGTSTRYSARAIHASREGAQAHEDMGFLNGWGTALDQLVEHMAGHAHERPEPFVPADFSPPTRLDHAAFRLRPLGPEHNERDHLAWMGSIDHIRATPGYPDGSWPQPMSLEQNLADLQRHQDDFRDHVGFTYTVLEADGPDDRADVVGCVYLYPDDQPGRDVHVQSWVRADLAHLDALLAATVRAWLEDAWPWRPEQIRDHPRHNAR